MNKADELNEFFLKLKKIVMEEHPLWVTPNSEFTSFKVTGNLHLMNISFDFVVSATDVKDIDVVPEEMRVTNRLTIV